MHYKNGREAKEGDAVVGRNANGEVTAGKVGQVIAGAESCNIYLGKDPASAIGEVGTAGDFWHAEDAIAALEKKGAKKRGAK